MAKLTKAMRAAVRASRQTPYAIGKGANVAGSQLSRLLSGQAKMTIDTIERLADYLGLKVTLERKGRAKKGR